MIPYLSTTPTCGNCWNCNYNCSQCRNGIYDNGYTTTSSGTCNRKSPIIYITSNNLSVRIEEHYLTKAQRNLIKLKNKYKRLTEEELFSLYKSIQYEKQNRIIEKQNYLLINKNNIYYKQFWRRRMFSVSKIYSSRVRAKKKN